jgi:hypothetical protein
MESRLKTRSPVSIGVMTYPCTFECGITASVTFVRPDCLNAATFDQGNTVHGIIFSLLFYYIPVPD